MAVGVVQPVGHLAGDAEGVLQRKLVLSFEPIPQRLARHERHDVEQELGGFALGGSTPISPPESYSGRMWGCCRFAVEVDLAEKPLGYRARRPARAAAP